MELRNLLFANKIVLAAIPFSLPILYILFGIFSWLMDKYHPIRMMIIPKTEITINNSIWNYILDPVKKYWLNWTFISKKDYSETIWEEEKIISTDYLFWFWKLADKSNISKIEFEQNDRTFFYNIKSKIDFDTDYIKSHVANINLISDNSKVNQAISKLSPNTNVKLYWYLVNMKLTGDYYLDKKTSTKLDDIWYWSSEILYVTEMEVNWKTFK